MGAESKIEWCHHTFNPWRGCTKVSPGCKNCYAEKLSLRNPTTLGVWGDDGARAMASAAYWREPLKWDRAAAAAGERHRVFCASLADVFEDRPELVEPRHRLLLTIRSTPNLDWLLLTKRPENINRLLYLSLHRDIFAIPKNIWLGVSVEDQPRADERIPVLLQSIPSRPPMVKFLSCEPLLGPVDLSKWAHEFESGGSDIDWVIVGGESGPGARPMHPGWTRCLRDQCRAAGVAFHFKQWGEWSSPHQMSTLERERGSAMWLPGHFTPLSDRFCQLKVGKKSSGRLLDGRTWDEFPEVRP